VRLFKTNSPLFDFNSKDVWTMFHSFAFDFSVWEMFGALLFGGKLVIIPKSVAKDTALYLHTLEKMAVTVLNQTPSAFYNLSREAENAARRLQIRYVIFGGEALSPGKLQHWQNRYPSCRLINMYGITETTVHTTYKELSHEDVIQNRSNIGKAIPTVSCFVLDQNRLLVPAGIVGELYVGGAGVARGYLNREDLTKERFISHPFIEGERLYKSGDLVKQMVNGDLEYLGRQDDQVKIRGYRIELGEIENALLKNPQIEEAVVLAKENQNNEKELVAYITSKAELNSNTLRNYLKDLLPEYMQPAYFIQLQALPLNANGKVDKKSLPDSKGMGLVSGIEYVAPKDEIEEKLVKIWEDVLKRENIGVKDDFFDLGGHSLKIIKVINQINKQFGLKYDLKGAYVESTIESMSRQIKTDIWFKEPKVEYEDDCDEVKI
ncbi:MAG: non-ribosomal peptide synthetase, partial [Bacteroidia bacterium]